MLIYANFIWPELIYRPEPDRPVCNGIACISKQIYPSVVSDMNRLTPVESLQSQADREGFK